MKHLHYYNLLVAGCNPKNVSKVFVSVLMKKSVVHFPNWWFEVGCSFIKQLFQAVGLKCSLTGENLRRLEYDGWRQENLSYVFAYEASNLHLIEQFLTHLGEFVDEFEQNHQNLEGFEQRQWASPLLAFLAVVLNWINVTTVICTEDSFNGITDKYFREPIALLSFFLLKCVAPLEDKYKETYPMMKEYISMLSWVMSYGVLYRRTHKVILDGMLELIDKYHMVFIVFDSKQWIFFQRVILCDNVSSIKLLAFLAILLEKWSAPQVKEIGCLFFMRELLDILMKKKMLNTYYTIITTVKTKRTLLAVLKFLNVLQSKLISAEGFTKNFLNGVLMLVLEHRDKNVRRAAADLYTQIVRPQTDYNTLLHILSVYTSAMSTGSQYFSNWNLFHNYIDELADYLPMMNLLASYVGIIKNERVKMLVRKVAAKSIVYVFKKHQYKLDEPIHKTDILNFLMRLPNMCHITSQVLVPIVVDIYTLFDCQYFAENTSYINKIISNLEDFGFELVINDNLDITDLEAMIINLLKFIDFSKNKCKIIDWCTEINLEFKQQEHYLTVVQAKSEKPVKALLSNYYSTLACVGVLIQNQLTHGIDMVYILSCLFERFYPECMYDTAIKETKVNLYRVAYPLICKIIILLGRDNYELGEYVHSMEITISRLLIDADPNDEILCAELFKSFVLLHIEFASNKSFPLTLTAKNYHIMMCSLELQLSKGLHNAQRSYVNGMFEAFKHLIRNVAITLPNSTIWKLLMHYKLKDHIFNNDLKSIIDIFLHKHTRNYARALPIIFYKLHMKTPHPKNSRIKRAIMSHLELINDTLPPLSAWILKLHCFLSTLDIIKKAITLTSANDSQNRMLPLCNLLLIIKGMRLKRRDFRLSKANIRGIKAHMLNTVEKNTISKFRGDLRKYKDLCLHEAKMSKKKHDKFSTSPKPTMANFPYIIREPYIKIVAVENNEIIFNEEMNSDAEYDDDSDGDNRGDYSEVEEVNQDSDENNEDNGLEEDIYNEEVNQNSDEDNEDNGLEEEIYSEEEVII